MSSPQVGDVLTTIDQLDACPEGTIVRYSDFWVFVRRDDGEWDVTGAYSSRTSDEVFDAVDEVTVVWVPPVTEIVFVSAVESWRHPDHGRTGLLRDDALLPFVGERVRVTVEKIGADDE